MLMTNLVWLKPVIFSNEKVVVNSPSAINIKPTPLLACNLFKTIITIRLQNTIIYYDIIK